MALLRLKTEIECILSQHYHSNRLLNQLIQYRKIDIAIRRYEVSLAVAY